MLSRRSAPNPGGLTPTSRSATTADTCPNQLSAINARPLPCQGFVILSCTAIDAPYLSRYYFWRDRKGRKRMLPAGFGSVTELVREARAVQGADLLVDSDLSGSDDTYVDDEDKYARLMKILAVQSVENRFDSSRRAGPRAPGAQRGRVRNSGGEGAREPFWNKFPIRTNFPISQSNVRFGFIQSSLCRPHAVPHLEMTAPPLLLLLLLLFRRPPLRLLLPPLPRPMLDRRRRHHSPVSV